MLTHVRHRRPRRRAPISARARNTGTRPLTIDLAHPDATIPRLCGAKATNLAVATAAGLPVLPGLVLTEGLCDAIAAAGSASRLRGNEASALHDAWTAMGGDRQLLVVRSSSRAEDGARSSLAGQFTSVLGVATFDDFVAAVDDVVRSAQLISLDEAKAKRAPMAVLVQPQLDAVSGGVMFGIDPVTGRSDRLVVAAVAGGPDRLVSGLDSGATHSLTRRGRLLSVEGETGPRLSRGLRRQLAGLADDVATTFGAPQDVEWAVDTDGTLWLLQSRPVTAAAVASKRKTRVLGPGPVGETFPDALSPLEEDLWLAPLNDGLREALLLAGLASRHRLTAKPPLVVVDGRAAVDLDVLGASPLPRPFFARFDPVPPARRVRAAWRTGRLRAALPALAADVLARADAELASVRPPATLPLRQLLTVLDGSRQALVSVHGFEVLIGLLASASVDGARTAAGRALHVLHERRAAGVGDTEIIASDPIVLSLVPPSIRPHTLLPEVTLVPAPTDAPRNELADLREELRLRARWLHELTAMVAWEAGTRLHREGKLPAAGAVRWLRLDELRAAVDRGMTVPDLDARRRRVSAPLPAAFRLAVDGRVIAVSGGASDRGQGAGGGRAVGTVFRGNGVPPAGAVLVVRTLDPSLAPVLPHLGGVIAETGSVLSHLAILAREFGVPTVVGVAGAVDRFPAGTEVVIDGTTGDVHIATEAEEPR